MGIIIPLASNQRDVWYDQATYPNSPVYNIGGYLYIQGEINHALLEKATNQLVAENDALRLVIYQENGNVIQSVSNNNTVAFEYIDFSNEKKSTLTTHEWLNRTFQQPFSLEQKKSLLQFALIKESASRYYLLTKYHHIIADGWTTKIVIARLAELYNALLQNRPIANAPQQSYLDYVKQEQDYLASDAYQRDANYWLLALPTLPPPLIEKRYPTTQNESLPKANIHKFTLNRSFYNRINQFALAHKSTTYHVLLSALGLYFSRTTQQNKIVIGVPSLNRNGARFKDVLGMFVSLSPLCLNVDVSGDVNQLMKTCGKTLREAYRYQRFPLGAICKRLEIMRNKRNTLFDLVLSYERQEYSMPFGSAAISAHQQFSGVARYPLAVTICEFHDLHDVEVILEGAENAFTPQDLEMLGSRIQYILEQMIARPQTLIGDIDLLPAHEKHLLFEQFNKTVTKTPFAPSVTQQFQHQAELNPDAIAVEYSATRLSYRQLDLLSNRHAHPLIHLGARANKIVAICVPRCPEMLIGMLAILKTTAAYLPIDPDTPTERIAEMLRQSNAVALLCLTAQKKRLAALHPHLVILDKPSDNHPHAAPKRLNSDAHDLAYLIFTSGSTGRPKGVMLEHEALSIRLRWLQEAFKITSEDRIAQTIQFSFDPSIIEIFLALTQGACLVLAPTGHQTPAAMAQFIVEQKITALALVPSSLRNLMQGLEQHATTRLRVACCGGEVLPTKLAYAFINKTG
ncbi:MAG: condensation domain-containing protein, partial [Sulfuricurvum sp.]|nr:condensation domain-containing protein [Sulfuricurvum sp.]